jgi:hypothetical protein
MTYTDEERTVFGDAAQGDTEAANDWLAGSPMDPSGTVAEPLPSLPGFPFLYARMGAVIVGPTGGGRSALLQACLYDAARTGLHCMYLGSEVGVSEFNARAAFLAECRGDAVDDELRSDLARVRYLDCGSTIVQAWGDAKEWVKGVVGRYDVLAIDPLSAVESALDFNFEQSNNAYIGFHDKLIQPLIAHGVAVVAVDNVGHAEEAKRRAKGASAKSDRADLTFSCAPSSNPVGLVIKAQKVRSIRAGHQRGDEWLFVKDSQRIERREHDSADHPTFRPTGIMEKVSKAVEATEGLSKTAIRTTVGGRLEYVDLALALLLAEGNFEARKDGQAHRHYSLRPYREHTDSATESTQSQPSPNPVPDSVPATQSNPVPLTVGKGLDGDWVSGANQNGNRVPPLPRPTPTPKSVDE